MKKIEAVIRHFKLTEVINALRDVGVSGAVISEVMGVGRWEGQNEIHRPTGYGEGDLNPKIKIEMVVQDGISAVAVVAIIRVCRTGKPGDGKVFVSDIFEMVSIRTGERVI